MSLLFVLLLSLKNQRTNNVIFLFFSIGYGATTLPALTEAITIDKNLTAAVEESERLVKLLAGMVEALRV